MTPALKPEWPYRIAGREEAPNLDLEVRDKFSNDLVARVAAADEATINAAFDACARAERPMAALKAYQRREALDHCVRRFEERFDELALALCIEAGKPIRDARGEVVRLIETFRIAAGEAERMTGEVLPLDNAPRSADYRGMWRRVPVGACSFISPFNFPLNLTAHKVAPAIAVGCPFVLKPASLTPLGALIIGDALAETDLPEGAFSVLPCSRRAAKPFVEHPKAKLLSFTGSPAVGWALKAQAGKKRVELELGGNAACVIDADPGDMDDIIERVIFGAFYQSGQSCIGVQRILVHESVYDAFKARFVQAASVLKTGNPRDEDTFIGPMITEKAAAVLAGKVADAIAKGATLLCGGKRDGAMLEATVLENAPSACAVVREEAFGPVAILSRFADFADAIAEVNDSVFGLQVGVFTQNLNAALRAWDEMEVGGVVVGDVPSMRIDNMPYGGVKDSGLGREGVRFAMEAMTEIRMLTIRNRP